MLPGPGFNFMFTIIPVIVIGMFVFVIGSIIFRTVSNLSSPVLVRDARVVAKRQHTSGHHHHGTHHHHSSTSYYVTFEFPDGQREELQTSASQFGMLAEGDEGVLRSQGTWFKGFERGTGVR